MIYWGWYGENDNVNVIRNKIIIIIIMRRMIFEYWDDIRRRRMLMRHRCWRSNILTTLKRVFPLSLRALPRISFTRKTFYTATFRSRVREMGEHIRSLAPLYTPPTRPSSSFYTLFFSSLTHILRTEGLFLLRLSILRNETKAKRNTTSLHLQPPQNRVDYWSSPLLLQSPLSWISLLYLSHPFILCTQTIQIISLS